MTFRVVVTAQAEADLIRIGDWIHQRSPDGAQRWTTAAWEAINSLRTRGRSCALARENAHCDREIRNVLFRTRKGRTYRAVYFVEDDVVTVTNVRGPGQQILPPEAFNDF